MLQVTGETRRGEGSGLSADFGRRPWRESDRVIVPSKPGNSGRGKDPDFWYALEGDEAKVIGRKARNTGGGRIRPKALCRKAKALRAGRV